MNKPKVFLDSSALIAGVLSSTGAARALLVLSENENIELFINEHVITECERAFARKVPEALPEFRNTIKNSMLKILNDPTAEKVQANLHLIQDPQDVAILLSAQICKADFLITHNRKHFIDDPQVPEKAGLRIGTPGDALEWLREQI